MKIFSFFVGLGWLKSAREKAVASALIFAAEQCVRKAGASDARAAGIFSSGSRVLPSKFPYFVHPGAEFDAALAIFFVPAGDFFCRGFPFFSRKNLGFFVALRRTLRDTHGQDRIFRPRFFTKFQNFLGKIPIFFCPGWPFFVPGGQYFLLAGARICARVCLDFPQNSKQLW